MRMRPPWHQSRGTPPCARETVCALDTHLALLGAVPVAGRAGGAWRALPAHSGPVGDVASAFSSVWCVVCVPVSTLCPRMCLRVCECVPHCGVRRECSDTRGVCGQLNVTVRTVLNETNTQHSSLLIQLTGDRAVSRLARRSSVRAVQEQQLSTKCAHPSSNLR